VILLDISGSWNDKEKVIRKAEKKSNTRKEKEKNALKRKRKENI
jgi:hypothetical protein